VARNFVYEYTQQGTFGLERQLLDSLSFSVDYTYAHGSHLLRPRNINQGNFELITTYARATLVCPELPGVSTNGCANSAYGGTGGGLAGLWDALGGQSTNSLAPLGQLLFNQFLVLRVQTMPGPTRSLEVLVQTCFDTLVRLFNLPHAPVMPSCHF
jgi:hypothetical protein